MIMAPYVITSVLPRRLSTLITRGSLSSKYRTPTRRRPTACMHYQYVSSTHCQLKLNYGTYPSASPRTYREHSSQISGQLSQRAQSNILFSHSIYTCLSFLLADTHTGSDSGDVGMRHPLTSKLHRISLRSDISPGSPLPSPG